MDDETEPKSAAEDRHRVEVPDFLSLAGSVPVPPEKRGMPWSETLRQMREARATRLRDLN